MSDLGDKQKLVSICFEIALKIWERPTQFSSQVEVAEWVARQLDGCGFPTEPCGASWGVLIPGLRKRLRPSDLVNLPLDVQKFIKDRS